MFKTRLNWRFLFTILAFSVMVVSIYLSHEISKSLELAERSAVQIWAKSILSLSSDDISDENTLNLLLEITSSNSSTPVILTDSAKQIVAIKNIDTVGIPEKSAFLMSQVEKFEKQNAPMDLVTQNTEGDMHHTIYYGDSNLLILLRYFPYILIVTLFVLLVSIIVILNVEYNSSQNKLWLGMSKETAHQLGTPLSSLQGWVDLLRTDHQANDETEEMQKDIDRLNLVVDRFSKIGSKPQLTESNITKLIDDMVDYMRKRASRKVEIHFEPEGEDVIGAVNPQLFTWVIENLIRNAIDVLKGEGNIWLRLNEKGPYILLEIQDDGAGIAPQDIKKIFNPGFTTKKRGWGIGLSLSKRIIDKFHGGSIVVKNSVLNEGTTFQIKLKKQSTEDIRKKY